MAEVNILGDRFKPEYIAGDAERFFLPNSFLVNYIAITLSSPQYFECIFELMYKLNGITALLFQIVIYITITFPWISTCYFIGQYTRKSFLNLKNMSPLFKCK